ncbi:MAG: glutathione peroxidase [Ferruginibacter sp.]
MIQFLMIGSVLLSGAVQPNNLQVQSSQNIVDTSVYDFKVAGLEGGTIDLAAYKGKKIMIVNTASRCGNTPQYAELETLYEKYKDKLVIIGFPANNFGAQEPGTNAEINTFCKKNYGVSFPMAAKVSVKGDDIHPLFKYLVAESAKMGIPDPIQWNFTKFLLDENGKLIMVIHNKKSVLSDDVINKL